jgi:polysaccharide biosynthesis protein PslH
MANVLSLVSYTFLPAKMGGQKGIGLFNQYLAKHLPLTCVTTQRNDVKEAQGYEALNLLSTSPLRYVNPFYFFTLRKIIRQKKISHLIIEHPYYGWLGILLKWFCGVKLIVHSHNIEAHRFKSTGKWWWRILWLYEKCTHRAAHFSFFISDEDRRYALAHFGIRENKCTTITYGMELAAAPDAQQRAEAKEKLRAIHSIAPGIEHIFLFNGTLDYAPNLNALKTILNTINPALLLSGLQYKIIICGRFLPAAMNDLKDYADKNILYAGFVDDISVYFKGADIFLNPVVEGGGIKTKLVEAIGYNMNAVSSASGAIGINPAICGGKLQVVADGDWFAFAEKIKTAATTKNDTPMAFYDHFYWGSIAQKAAAAIKSL